MRLCQVLRLSSIVVLAAWSADAATIHVPSDRPTIQLAIDAAAVGDTVLVAAGKYVEQLRLKEGVVLQGENAESVTVQCHAGDGSVLTCEGLGSGTVRHLTLVHTGAAELPWGSQMRPPVVKVVGSTITMEGCQVMYSGGDGLHVEGTGEPTFISCKMLRNSFDGAYVVDGGRAYFRDCAFRQNYDDGIELRSGLGMKLEGCRVMGNRVRGITVSGSDAELDISGCEIKNNGNYGVIAHDSTKGQIRKCNILLNGASGIGVEGQGGAMLVAENTCDRNWQNGIFVGMGASPQIDGNTCTGNATHGICIQNWTAAPAVNNNTCSENKSCGIFIGFGAQGTYAANETTKNVEQGIRVFGFDTSVTLEKNTVADNGMNGVLLQSGAQAVLKENNFQRNGKHGIRVDDQESKGLLEENQFAENAEGDESQGEDPKGIFYLDEREAGWLLSIGAFDRLNQLETRCLAECAAYPLTAWPMLTSFCDSAKDGYGHFSPRDPEKYYGALAAWSEAYPNSQAPGIVYIFAKMKEGFDARGIGFANTVSQQGWKIFKERTAEAREKIAEIEEAAQNNPEFHHAALYVGRCDGWPDKKMDDYLARCAAICPMYIPSYQERAESLLPRWGGSPRALKALAERARELEGERGNEIYALIAAYVYRREGYENEFSGEYDFDWEYIGPGFEAFRAKHESTFHLNLHCLSAAIHGQKEVAAPLFEKIGDRWDRGAWMNETSYRRWYNWALGSAPLPEPKPTAPPGLTPPILVVGTMFANTLRNLLIMLVISLSILLVLGLVWLVKRRGSGG